MLMAKMNPHEPLDDLRAPSLALLALEFRAPWEFGALLPAWPALQRAPAGDGHPVIVFPGLSASDASTIPLRRYIGSLGYQTQGWSQGFNFGPRAGVLESAKRQVQEACDASGAKVSLLGWSLGGVYARELAKEMPDSVRGVITLGTPFAGPPRSTNAWRIYELTSGRNIAARNRPIQPARSAARAHHQHLVAQRRHRGLARQLPAAGGPQPAHRKHRSRGQPHRHRPEPQRLVGRGRPAGPARRGLDAV
jgi:pimeloyl-ACP methyl ester carboxylesterase